MIFLADSSSRKKKYYATVSVTMPIKEGKKDGKSDILSGKIISVDVKN